MATLAPQRSQDQALVVRTASKRVKRVLKLVDELDRDELRVLRDELDARQECEIDLDVCTTDDERALAQTVKRRIDAAARGETRMIPMGEAMRIARQGLRRRRATP